MVTFELRIAIKTSCGRIGRQTITADGATGPVVWEGDPEGDGETTEVEIAVFERCGDDQIDVFTLDGEEWRKLEDGDMGLKDALRWINHPDMNESPHTCVRCAMGGYEPPGWTDAHERVEELLAELKDAERVRETNEELLKSAHRALEVALRAFDRMAHGESFNAVCESTGATASMTETRVKLDKALVEAAEAVSSLEG